MPIERNELELYRAGWRRWRSQCNLTDPEADDFGTGGLATRIETPTVRLLILPPDPENDVVEFDADFWEWWQTLPPEPATGRTPNGLHAHVPTAHAAAHYGYSRSQQVWERYLALYRNGGLEMEMGDSGARTIRDEQRCFVLTSIVGRLWYALEMYGQIVERFSLTGPWEVTVALSGTKGALVGGFGEGWAEPFSGFSDALPCADSNLLFRREVMTWPGKEDIQDFAFRLGGQIEDAWGVFNRRFLARTGPEAGKFAVRTYR